MTQAIEVPELVEPTDASEEDQLQAVIEQLVELARDGRVTLTEVTTAIDELDVDPTQEEPDVSVVLAGLAARDIDVDNELDEKELTEASVRATRLLTAQVSEDGELDALAQWQRDALRHPVLKREEEVELTTRYGLYNKTARALEEARVRFEARIEAARAELERAQEVHDMMSDPELGGEGLDVARAELAKAKAELDRLAEEASVMEHEINRARAAASEAEQIFLAYNFRLVFALANRKFRQAGRKGELLDLVQQGNEGMIAAFRKFDPALGYKFSTFATWHINQTISQWLYEQVGVIKVPTHRWRDARRIGAFRRQFHSDHGRQPTNEEIGEALSKTAAKIGEILDAETKTRIGSLDKPISEEDGSETLGGLVSDPGALTPEQQAVREALKGLFSAVLERSLDGRERRVLQLRFGLEDEIPRTLDWIGRRMNITRERVRQIEARALEKLRKDAEISTMAHLEGRSFKPIDPDQLMAG